MCNGICYYHHVDAQVTEYCRILRASQKGEYRDAPLSTTAETRLHSYMQEAFKNLQVPTNFCEVARFLDDMTHSFILMLIMNSNASQSFVRLVHLIRRASLA